MRASLILVVTAACGGGQSPEPPPPIEAAFALTGSSCRLNTPPSVTANVDFELSLNIGDTFQIEVVTSNDFVLREVEKLLLCGAPQETEDRYPGSTSSGLNTAACQRNLATEPDAVIGTFQWQATLETLPATTEVTLLATIFDEADVELQSEELVVDCEQL